MPVSKKERQSAKERIQRTEAYADKVRQQFAGAVNDILALNKRLPELKEGQMYSFDGAGKRMRREVDSILRELHSATVATVRTGITQEWNEANKAVDEILATALGRKALSNPNLAGWFDRNEKAMDSFLKRTQDGFNLSRRIWNTTTQLREEMEVAMTVAIGEGESASAMSRRVRQYLNDPDLMFRRFRYKDDEGNWQRKWKKKVVDSDGHYHFVDYDRDSYKVGAGQYKSAYKNAMRVTRTETNIAYRRADHERWQGLDFVLGQHIEVSRSHPKEDICDELAGDYPKDFVFDGWHPQCFCICTPIMADEEEMKREMEAALNGEDYEPSYKPITTYPKGFQKFLDENREKIEQAQKAGTAPYFIMNNEAVVQRRFEGEDLTQTQAVEIPPEIAKEYDKYADLFPDVRKWYGKYTPGDIKEAYDSEEFILKKYAQLSTDEEELQLLDYYLNSLSQGYNKHLKAVEVIKDYCQRRRDTIKETIKKREEWEKQWLLAKHKNTAIVTTLDEFNKLSGEDRNRTLIIWDKGEPTSRGGMLADKVLFDGASKNWCNSSGGLKDSIHGYTEGSGHLNLPLQGRNFGGVRKQTLQQFTEDVNNTTEYISRESLPCDMVLKRVDDNLSAMEGRLNFMGKQMPADVKDLVGVEVKDFGFMSTTGGDAFTFKPISNVVMHFYVPKGTKAAYVEPFSYYGKGAKKKAKGRDWDGVKHLSAVSEEDEVTLQRGTRYVIRRVEESRGKTLIWCDIVGQDPSDFSYVTKENLSH